MSAGLEKRCFGGPDSGKWNFWLLALLLAAPWRFLQPAMTLRL